MRRKIIGITSFLILFFVSFGFAQTADPVTTYQVSKTNGTCLSNGSVKVTFPQPPSGTYQNGWVAELRIAGSTTQGQLISVPSNGGDITFNSLSPNNYSLTVANGFQTITYASNPISISSSYVNMSITVSSVAPTCKNTALNYADNGTFTINVPTGGIGPFLYTVTSPANGVQTFQTPNRSHTFSGMKGGETVSYSVQDLGCGATNSASFTIASNTLADLKYAFRAYNFIRDCSDCSSATFYVNLDAATTNIANRLTILQQPGNAVVTINGTDYNLTYVGTLTGGHHRFRYDRPSGGPVLTNGMSITTKFNWGCDILTETTTVRMDNSFLNVFSTPIVDNSTCSVKYRLTMIGDQDATGSQRNIYFCADNSLTVEKLDPNTGLYSNIFTGSLNVYGLNQADPAASNAVILDNPGTYRVTATDACHTVVKSITILPSSPIDNVTISSASSVLQGTVGMSFGNLSNLKYPFMVKLERTDAQTSVTIPANNPLDLAANYTVNFPLTYTFNSNPGTSGNIIDLPIGEYKVTLEDACTASSGRRKIQTINLTNAATYSPTFSVSEACLNSNSISYALNRGTAAFLPAFVQLRTKNSDGSEGAIISTVTNTNSSGTFNNLASGDYYVKFTDVGNGYSAARNIFGPFSYRRDITIAAYENIEIDISTVFCDVNNTNSGIVSAEVISGTLIYPLTMAVYRQSDNALIQGPITITSPAKGTVFTGLSTGNYYIRTTSACYTFDKNFSLSTASTPPVAQVSQGAVCPGSPTTVAVISATNNLYDITWLIKNSDGTENIVGYGMPLPLTPNVTTTYTARFTLKSTFGCQSPPVYESDVTVNVTDNPLLDRQVSDIDICLNPNPSVTIADSQTGFIYEILNPQGLSYSPKVVSAISTGANLDIPIPSHVSLTPGTKLKVQASNSNAGCSGILIDEVNILQSTANLSLDVEASYVCAGSDGSITIKNVQDGITYTVFKNGAALNPSILGSKLAGSADLTFTIPAVLLTSASNTFTIQASGASCATGGLTESAVITVQQAPSASTLIHAICGVQKGSISLSTFGGSGNYEYKLGINGAWGTSNLFSDLDPGIYTVFSRDLVTACESQNTVEILQYCLELTKTSTTNPNNFDALGDALTYDILVKNTGNVALSNIAVNDPGATLSSATISSLAPGASATVSASYTVTQADLDAGSFTNTATASTIYNNVPVSDTDSETVSATQVKSLSLTKTADKQTYILGDFITYTLSVENTGNVTLSNVSIVDPMSGLSAVSPASIPTLAPGATSTFTATYTATQADVDAGKIENTATASASFNSVNYTDEDTESILAVQNPEVSITKTANATSYSAEGQVLNYSILVKNTGNVTLSSLQVVDPLTGLSQTIPSLAPGAEESYSTSYTVKNSDLALNKIDNTATVTYSFNGTTEIEQASASVPNAYSIDGINCSANSYAISNNTETDIEIKIPYTGGIAANYPAGQPIALNNGTLTATLQAGTINPAGGELVYRLTGTPSNSTTVILPVNFGGKNCNVSIFIYEPNESSQTFFVYPFNDKNNNCVRDAGENSDGLPETGLFIKVFDLSNNLLYSSEISFGQFDVLDLNIKTDLIYYYIIDNDDSATDLEPTLPTGWKSGMSDPNLKRYFQFDGSVLLQNTAPIANLQDPSWENIFPWRVCLNQDVGTIDELDCSSAAFSGLLAVKQSTSGKSFSINYTGGNGGYYEGQEISSTGISGLKLTLAAGSFNAGSGSLIFDLSGTPTSAGAGKFNLTIAGKTCEINFFIEEPAITITKTASSNEYKVLGEELTYNISVTNTGKIDLINVMVKDPLTGLDQMIASLVAGATSTLTTTYTVKQSDLDAGAIVNKATTSFSFGGEDYTKEASATVDASQNPAITITKTAVQTSYAAVGDVLNYSIVVTNTGNVTLNSVKVIDPLTGLDQMIASLAVGETKEFTTNYVINSADIIAKNVENIAQASFVFEGKNYGASAKKTVPIVEAKSLIQAINDNYSDRPINILESGRSGNIFANDLLNGSAIQPSDVNVSIVNHGGLIGLRVDEDGYLIVPKGSAPGRYIIRYRICERLDPNNCSEADVILELFQGVNLRIFKTVNSANAFEGNELEYQIRVENNGSTEATNVIVVDDLPEGLRYVSSTLTSTTAQTNVNNQKITWTIPSLAAGQIVEIKLRVKAAPLTNGIPKTIANIARASSKEMEMTPEDNSALATVRIDAFFIPNTITPNGDSDNDTFEIPGLNRFVSNELVIFNRWNDHVFQRKDYKNDWAAQGLVSGTYFYVLKVKDEAGKTHEFKGFIQVVKESIR